MAFDTLRKQTLVGMLVEKMRQADSWTGSTHVQKTMYAFQTLFECDPDLKHEYVLHRHGPYSFELDDNLSELRFYRGIELQAQRPPYGPRYAVRPEFGGFRVRFGAELERLTDALEFVAREVGGHSVRPLEALSTVMWVKNHPSRYLRARNAEGVVDEVRRLKDHLTVAEVEWAISEFERLRQAAQQSGKPKPRSD